MFQRFAFSQAARRCLAVAASCASIVAVSVLQAPVAWAETPAAAGDLGVIGSYILVDADTGLTLASKNEHNAVPVASLTKILTALVAVDRLDAGAKIAVSAEAAGMPARRMGIQVGQQWPLEDAMYSMLLASANDVAYAIGEAAGGGTITGFANQLSVMSSRLGLADKPVLKDPSGLDDNFSIGGGNLVSARDLAIAGRAALANKRIAPIIATKDYTFKDPSGATRQLSNHNKLLANYAGTTGLKTGFTDKAGRCLMASATRNGRTMLVVVLDTPGMWDVAPQLMDYGFSIPQAVEPVVDRLPAPPGISNLVIATAETPTTVAAATPAGTSKVDIGDAVTIENDGVVDPEAAATQSNQTTTKASNSGSSVVATLVKSSIVLLVLGVVLLRTRAVLRRKRRKQRQLLGSVATAQLLTKKRLGHSMLAHRASRNAQASTQVIVELSEMIGSEDEVILQPTATDDRYDVVEVHANVRQAHGLSGKKTITTHEDTDVVVVDASDDWNNDTDTDTYRRPRL